MRVLGVVLALLAWMLAATVALAEEPRWQKLENNPDCVVWIDNPQEQETVTWSGTCANGKAEGHGTAVSRYVEDGEWKEDRYEGGMKDGKINGRGVYGWADGDRYEGNSEDGKPNGRGVFELANGDRYEGDFKDCVQHGRGIYVWADGVKCEGDWREGKLIGKGKGWAEGREVKCYFDGNAFRFKD